MVDNPHFMLYNPVMCTTSSKDVMDILDDSLNIKLVFVRELDIESHVFQSWMARPYHAICILETGGPIRTRFVDNPDEIITRCQGSVCLLPAYRKRQTEFCSESSRIKLAALTCKVFGDLDFFSFWDLPFLFDPEIAAALKSKCDTLLAAENDESVPPLKKVIIRKSLCFEIFKIIIDNATLKPDTLGRINSYHLVKPALASLERHFNQPLTIGDMARSCSLSRSQFHHNFKQSTGVSPLEYQQRLRIAEAKKLLLQTNASIAEIGERVGWRDQFHFSRIFKKNCGCSPAFIRKSYQRELMIGGGDV